MTPLLFAAVMSRLFVWPSEAMYASIHAASTIKAVTSSRWSFSLFPGRHVGALASLRLPEGTVRASEIVFRCSRLEESGGTWPAAHVADPAQTWRVACSHPSAEVGKGYSVPVTPRWCVLSSIEARFSIVWEVESDDGNIFGRGDKPAPV